MSNLPRLTEAACLQIIREAAKAKDFKPEPWLIEAVQAAYGRGRYDEASAETFEAAFW